MCACIWAAGAQLEEIGLLWPLFFHRADVALYFLQGSKAGRNVVALLLFGLLWPVFPPGCRLAGLLWPCCYSGCCGPERWLARLAGWAAVAQAVCTFALDCLQSWQGCCALLLFGQLWP